MAVVCVLHGQAKEEYGQKISLFALSYESLNNGAAGIIFVL